MWAGVLRQRCHHDVFNQWPNETLATLPSQIIEDFRLKRFYEPRHNDFLCSLENSTGLHTCHNIPASRNSEDNTVCTVDPRELLNKIKLSHTAILANYSASNSSSNSSSNSTTPSLPTITLTDLFQQSSCVNWNKLYTVCKATPQSPNPYDGSVSFDNILMAWNAIFQVGLFYRAGVQLSIETVQVVTLEGWSDIMYLVQDSYSFYAFLFFVPLILVRI